MSEFVYLSGLLPEEFAWAAKDRFWSLPSWAFKPDAWTVAFLRGLSKLALTNETLWEVGVGSGIVSLFLWKKFPQIQVAFSDFDQRAVELSVENIANGGALDSRFNPLHGSWSLVESSRQKTRPVDVVVACIPQAPLPTGKSLLDADHLAHYYDSSFHQSSKFNHLGLGLNETLLVRARERALNPSGRVVLNLAGRPTKVCLLEMFRSCGYKPRILHEEIIQQDSETCLQSFVNLEQEGSTFEFFSDARGEATISAAEAEVRRLSGQTVYHKIYVIEGTVL